MDNGLIAQYDKRCSHVRNLVHHTINDEQKYGLYIWGPHGCGKSTGIEKALHEFHVPYIILAGTATGPGLFLTLAAAKEKVIWVNDDPNLMKDRQAIQYLLHMLEPRLNPITQKWERQVTRTREKVKEGEPTEFVFSGKIIFDANVGLGKHPVLRAVKDRLTPLPFEPSNEEMAAVIRYWVSLAGDGTDSEYEYIRTTSEDQKLWAGVSVEERQEVAEYVLALEDQKKIRHSMRQTREIIRYRIAAQKEGYSTDWTDHAQAIISQDSTYEHSQTPSRKNERIEKERQELREQLEDVEGMNEFASRNPNIGKIFKSDVITLWLEMTGNTTKKQFYRRLDELPKEYRAMYEALPDKRSK